MNIDIQPAAIAVQTFRARDFSLALDDKIRNDMAKAGRETIFPKRVQPDWAQNQGE